VGVGAVESCQASGETHIASVREVLAATPTNSRSRSVGSRCVRKESATTTMTVKTISGDLVGSAKRISALTPVLDTGGFATHSFARPAMSMTQGFAGEVQGMSARGHVSARATTTVVWTQAAVALAAVA
jgi:hypothetical protein